MNSVADPITPLVMSGGNDTSPGDPYLDADESGTYSVGEQYFNIQNLPTRQTDSGNPYIGLLCGGPNPTTLPALCNGKPNSTTFVGAQSIIVMSTGLAQIAWPLIPPPSGSSAAPTGQDVRGGSFVVYISDLNGNPMPAGTTVGVSGLPGSVTATPSSEGFGCDDTPYGTALDPMGTVNGQMHLDSLGKPMGKAFTFGITDPSATPTGTQGTVTVTVTTPAPNKSLTSASVPITY